MSATLPKEVRISGFAVPFGVPNSYNETLAPGALDDFVARVNAKGAKLPMGFMHEFYAGEWDKLEVKPDGLYVEGRITDPATIAYLNKATFGTFTGELSITFKDHSNANDVNVEVTRERFNQLDAANHGQLSAKHPKWLHVAEARTTTKAKLSEISLVDNGAFRGTHFEPVKPLAI